MPGPHKSHHMRKSNCCRGRARTSTEQLAKKQSLVVNPGRLNPPFGGLRRLYFSFILLSPPPRRGGMSAKYFITPQYNQLVKELDETKID